MADKPKKVSQNEDDKTAKTAGKQSASSAKAAKSDEGMKDLLSQFMKNMDASFKKQEEKIKLVCDRVNDLDSAMQESYGAYEYEDYEGMETCEVPPPTHAEHGTKRPSVSDENNNSRFSLMSKKFKQQEITDESIDSVLASNITDLFRNGIDEDHYNSLVKDEKNPRPENCEGLVTVRTNQMIWDHVSPSGRTTDRKLQCIGTSVVKAATILAKTVNSMAMVEKEHERFNDMIESSNDVLALLGHTNKQVNLLRRDLLKPEIHRDYAHLCNHTLPYSKELFGDDVSKTAKEIEDSAKISGKITKNFRGRGRYPSMYRPPMRYRGRGRGLSYRGRSHTPGNPDSAQYSAQYSGQESKNYPPRRGIQRRT